MKPMASDHELLQSYLSTKDRGTLDELFGRHYPSVFHVLLRMTSNEFDARDLAQTTFLKALAVLERYRPEGSFRHWLLKIAVNEFRQQHRKVQPRPAHDFVFEMYDELKQEHLQQAAERAEFERALQDALEQFPEDLRIPLVLHYYQDLSMADIGHMLDLPKSTVQDRLGQALRALRKRFQDKGFMALVPLIGEYLPTVPYTLESTSVTAVTGTTAVASIKATPLALGAIAMKSKLILVALFVLALLGANLMLQPDRNTAPLFDQTLDSDLEMAEPNTTADSDTRSKLATTNDSPNTEIAIASNAIVIPQADIHSQGPGIIVGQVLEQGSRRPVASAEIILDLNFSYENNWIGVEHPDYFRNRYYTDTEGRFQCDNLPLRTSYRITIRHKAYGYLHIPKTVMEQNTSRDLGVFFLAPAKSLRGTVTDTAGHGIAGVQISAGNHIHWQQDAFLATYAPMPLHGAKTLSDTDGLFQLDGLAPGYHHLEFIKSGYARAGIASVLIPETGPIEMLRVDMHPAARIQGTIIDSDGQPVQDVQINVRLNETVRLGQSGTSMSGYFSTTYSDAQGHFTISDLPEERQFQFSIFTRKDGFMKSIVRDILPGTTGLQIQLTATGTCILHGRILEKEGGRTILQPMLIQAWTGSKGEDPIQSFWSAEDGSYEIQNLFPGPLQLLLQIPGYLPFRYNVELMEGHTELDIELSKGATLYGYVLDEETNQPIVGAHVMDIFGSDSDDDLLNRSISDETGYYSLSGFEFFEETMSGQVVVQASGHQTVMPEYHLPASLPRQRLDILLPKQEWMTLQGQVVDEDGRGVPNTSIHADLWDQPDIDIRTDSQGRFSKKIGVPQTEEEEEYSILFIVSHFGYAILQKPFLMHELQDELTLPLQRGHRISGQVIDPQGQPMPGAIVILASANGDDKTLEEEFNSSWFLHTIDSESIAVCNSDGFFELPHAATGLHWIVPTAANATIVKTATFEDFVFDIHSDLTDLKLTLRQGGTVSGQVVDPTGKALSNLMVRAETVVGGNNTDSHGHFTIDSLFGDTVTLYIQDKFVTGRLEAIAVGSNNVTITAQPCGILHGYAVDPDRLQGLADFEFVIHWKNDGFGDHVQPLRKSYNGYFALKLPGGMVDITLRPRSDENPWQAITLSDIKIENGKTLDLGQIEAKK